MHECYVSIEVQSYRTLQMLCIVCLPRKKRRIIAKGGASFVDGPHVWVSYLKFIVFTY